MKPRNKVIRTIDGKFIGKVATVMCKTHKEFMKHFTGVKPPEKSKQVIVRVRPILNSSMLDVLVDKKGEII